MSNPQQPATTHRQLTGIVTKLVGDGALYGFINDEIFFPQTNVASGPASVGDQVFAECEYSAHLPIKWNATSIKIISKGGGQQLQVNNDPRQQEMIQGQQQQQQQPPPPFNQASPVAVTYQQHRQQRQQRQILDVKQPNNNMPPVQPNSELTTRLLDQAHGTGGEYFAAGNSRPFPQPQQAEANIQPFQEQPMGPNFTYTSQLGSAFVQNQFVPAPFMAQPPPTMLPQQPQQPPPQLQQPPQQQRQQQLIIPNNNQMHNQQSNQRQNQHNKGNRFNNQDKNDRQYNNNNNNNNFNNRRNQNRNDNKFDRPRSGDRDAQQGNNRAPNKRNDSRDRSLNKAKRDDIPVRPSPPPQSSAQSTTSVGSDKGIKSRRHYKTQNIPKVHIMTNMNSYNMKQRCPPSVHVPSDLKEIIVNRYFRLDIKNTPKPIKYAIDRIKKEVPTQQEETSKVAKAEDTEKPMDIDNQNAAIATEAKSENEAINESPNETSEIKDEEKITEQKTIELPTPPTSKSDLKLNHKYGVKVILVALPELDAIYKSVFGPNLDSFNLDSKSSPSLDESISLLCNRGSNNGYSFIGGRFDPVLDGFVEGASNEFERHGRQPDLIATCKRVVLEQTGLDLGPCRGWNLLSTFIYNNKSDYYSPKASIEYSYIYMPQIWTMLSENFDSNASLEKLPSPMAVNIADQKSSDEPSEINKTDPQDSEEALPLPTPSESAPDSNIESADAPGEVQNDEIPLCSENLSELKVTELKAELDKRNITYKAGIKKAELIALLQTSLNNLQADAEDGTIVKETSETAPDAAKQDDIPPSDVATSDGDSKIEATQLEEGEVDADGSTNDSPDETPVTKVEGEATLGDVEQSTGKRKIEESDEPSNKKICSESPVKDKRVELIKESFKVYTRDEQQQLVLVSLNEASLASRHDQFELSVASNILKESLAQHLSEYVLTTLVEDHRQKNSLSSNAGASTSSSQEASSDTNNNAAGKDTFKNPIALPSEHKVNLKELPVDRYINLAFSFFDASHTGYLYFEDLNKLFNNTGLSISKRALIALVGDGEKFNYRTLPDISPKLPPTYLYQFPEQFDCLPGTSTSSPNNSNLTMSGKMVEYKGVTYDVEKLIQQVKDAETLSVSLVDRFNYAIENSDKQAEEIHVLEVSQKSLAKAIKAQNDEICDLKRERDSFKKKCDSLRKGIKGTVTSLTDLIKDEK